MSATTATNEDYNDTMPNDDHDDASDNEFNEFARELDYNYYRSLHLAALKGDWESAKRFIEQDHDAVTAKISVFQRTALHIAAMEGQSKFLEKLVDIMPIEAISLPDKDGCSALHYAAIDGSLRAVKKLVSINPALAQIESDVGHTPLLSAAIFANEPSPQKKEVIWLLCLVTTDARPSCPFTGPHAGRLIVSVTSAGFYDISLYLLQNYPNLATAIFEPGNSLLSTLAIKPSGFLSGSRLGFMGRCIYPYIKVELSYTPPHVEGMPTLIRKNNSMDQVLHWFKILPWKTIELLVPCVKQARDAKWRRQLTVELVKSVCTQVSRMDYVQILNTFQMQNILATATTFGIVEILRICFEFFPDIIYFTTLRGYILEVAIEYRRENIFNLMNEMNGRNRILAESAAEHGYPLHLAAKLAPSSRLLSISGSAFQMQREMQWFKEVEKLVHPVYKVARNTEGKTAWEVFTEEHKDLVEKGEKWMKDTSNSCMVVSTLIATVVFAAAFTVPGGNSSDKGIPMFLMEKSFMIFAISDAIALFSSVTSLLMFLSILTSRYAEEDFLRSLPKRLIIGLASLFFAIAFMMVAFGATLSIVLSDRLKWVSIPISLLVSFPVIMFGMLQLPLFIQMVKSTYGHGIFHPEKPW